MSSRWFFELNTIDVVQLFCFVFFKFFYLNTIDVVQLVFHSNFVHFLVIAKFLQLSFLNRKYDVAVNIRCCTCV